MDILEKYIYPFGLWLIDVWIWSWLCFDKFYLFVIEMIEYIRSGWKYRQELLNITLNFFRLKILYLLGAGYVHFENGYYHVSYYDHLGTIRCLRWKKSRSPKTQIVKIFAIDEESEEIDITPFVEKFLGPDRSFPSLQLSPSELNLLEIKIQNLNGNEKIISSEEKIAF